MQHVQRGPPGPYEESQGRHGISPPSVACPPPPPNQNPRPGHQYQPQQPHHYGKVNVNGNVDANNVSDA